jgi:hypothetical protein
MAKMVRRELPPTRSSARDRRLDLVVHALSALRARDALNMRPAPRRRTATGGHPPRT